MWRKESFCEQQKLCQINLVAIATSSTDSNLFSGYVRVLSCCLVWTHPCEPLMSLRGKKIAARWRLCRTVNILNIYSVPECTGYIIFNLHSNYADLELLKTSSRSTEHANLIKLTWYLLSSRKWPFFKRTRITVSQVALLVLTNRFPNKCNTNRYPLCHAYSTIKAASWKIKGNFDSTPVRAWIVMKRQNSNAFR